MQVKNIMKFIIYSLGSTYVYTYAGGIWTQQSKLTAADGRTNDYFGNSVSNQDEIIVIGAMSHDINGIIDVGKDALYTRGYRLLGAVYIYESSSGIWSQQAKLVAPLIASYDYFGVSVRVSTQTMVVGAFGENALAINSGAAYAYTRVAPAAWTQEAKLLASDGTGDDLFGAVVDIDRSGNVIVVTAFGDDGRRGFRCHFFFLVSAGSAYIYERSSGNQKWSQMTKIVAADRNPSYITSLFSVIFLVTRVISGSQ